MKQWTYLKAGDIVKDGDLWCGINGDNPVPTLAYVAGRVVDKEIEQCHSYMRLVESSPNL